MLEFLLFGSFVLIFYAYFGYPLSLLLLSCVENRVKKKASFFPSVTIIITAYNEEKNINQKLENTLSLEYPREKLQIIVASDGSTDQTNRIVKNYEEKGVELFVVIDRCGKENAQKKALRISKGDIFVFTDVATIICPSGLKEIVSNFSDSSIGCVSSEDRMLGKNGNPSGEGFYVRYEMWLRRLESRACSLVGLSGSFFAARKDVCKDFSGEIQSDFRTVLTSIKMGLRAISDPQAIGYYKDVLNEKTEFKRKVRTVLRGLEAFFRHVELLNFSKYGLFSYQYFCHKLLRWMVPLFLCIAFISNLVLSVSSFSFCILFIGQMSFYGLAILGWQGITPTSHILLKIPMYFLSVNMSILLAWCKYLKGEKVVMWVPSER